MAIGYVGGWTSKAGLLVQDGGGSGSSKPVSQSAKVRQMLSLVGSNPTVLDIRKMDQLKLHKQIKGFDPTNVTTKSLGGMSTFLKNNGLISDITALNLINAGDKFDRFGIPKNPDEPFNALEYFAMKLDDIQNNNIKGNKYANYLVPEYKKAIYVLQSLQNYGKGNGTTVTDKNVSAKA
ncbi:hypothetical protein RZO07_16505 [Pseudomonas protegens]|uniref:Uncharacterized protein n=2 Tax=Pseudomonas TaxID=286 RepID=A0A9Q6N667_9PSED|nr:MULTISPECIES: hypothetical protein [Pseudomonas]AXK52097.1 hypothetical protein DWF74_01505 [Pseudomonas protegens]MBS7562657.1 hypothetical protein [Pseudomonas sp. RC4D1]MBW8357384.1 hypothetical protein [Pseudomonas sp.]MCL9658321.1 hypothetical protein [Pseudomonas protegens]MCO7579675.1 hypothetical protein [Pseudomonas protegens]